MHQVDIRVRVCSDGDPLPRVLPLLRTGLTQWGVSPCSRFRLGWSAGHHRPDVDDLATVLLEPEAHWPRPPILPSWAGRNWAMPQFGDRQSVPTRGYAACPPPVLRLVLGREVESHVVLSKVRSSGRHRLAAWMARLGQGGAGARSGTTSSTSWVQYSKEQRRSQYSPLYTPFRAWAADSMRQ